MKILITGAAGYIGSELCRYYTNQPTISKVIAYDNFSKGANGLLSAGINRKKLQTVKADILDNFKLRKALSDVDLVIHAAGVGSTHNSTDKDIHHYEQVNHWGTAELVGILEEKKIIRLIYFATTDVIGYKTQADNISQSQHISAFASSLGRAEEEIERLIARKRAIILRVGEVVGKSPNQDTESPLNKMVTDAILLNRVQITGNGNNQFPYTDMGSIIGACDAFITERLDCGTYNLVDGNTILREAADIIMESIPELEVIFVAHHFQPAASEVSNSLPESIKKEIPLQESLMMFLESFQAK